MRPPFLSEFAAHRYLVGYVYARTHSQTGALLQIWLLRRFGTLLAFQPILLGLILLSRNFWIEGGILIGSGVAVIIFVEFYASWKTRLPGQKALSAITQNSLHTFAGTARPSNRPNVDEESTSLVSSARGARTRGSMASVLEMMSLTLAVMPSPSPFRGPIPLRECFFCNWSRNFTPKFTRNRDIGRFNGNGAGCSDTSRCPTSSPPTAIHRPRGGNGRYSICA